MKAESLLTLVALGVRTVTATRGWEGDWGKAPSYKCPVNTDNKCTDNQKTGWTWEDLTVGTFETYDSFQFKGWTCKNTFGKRDVLTGRTFGSKCISGTASKDKPSCPSWHAPTEGSVNAMSITELQVSVEFDAWLEFHFSMEDGSNCVQKNKCSSSGSTVSNTQCGGAKSVTIVYSGSVTVTEKETCEVGIHSVGYDCSGPVPTSSIGYSSTLPFTSVPATSVPFTPVPTTSVPATSVPFTPVPTTSVPFSSPPASTFKTVSTTRKGSTSTFPAQGTPTTIAEITTASGVSTTSARGSFSSSIRGNLSTTETFAFPTTSVGVETTPAIPQTTAVITQPDILTTMVVVETVTTCPVTSTRVSAGVTTVVTHVGVSTVFVTQTSTYCPVCTEVQTTAIVGPSPTTPIAIVTPSTVPTSVVPTSVVPTSVVPTSVVPTSAVPTSVVPPYTANFTSTPTTTQAQVGTTTVVSVTTETAGCPGILPSCLNTWLFQTGCGSNTATDCFCGQTVFITNVFSCLSAHGETSTEIYQAQIYFQGICGPAIPNNPAIVTAATTFTDISTVFVATTIPVTAYTYATTYVQPVTVTATAGQSQGTAVPGSLTTITVTGVVTVPKVQFETVTVSGSSGVVGLVPAVTTVVATVTPVCDGSGSCAEPPVETATAGAPPATTPGGSVGTVGVVGTASTKTTASRTVSSTGGIATFTGAASSNKGSAYGGLAAAAMVAMLL